MSIPTFRVMERLLFNGDTPARHHFLQLEDESVLYMCIITFQ